MKIGSVNPIIGQYNQIKTGAARKLPEAQDAADSVELSPEALLFSEAFGAARKSMQGAMPGQEVKINQIMEQMCTGSYQVEVKDICDKLLS